MGHNREKINQKKFHITNKIIMERIVSIPTDRIIIEYLKELSHMFQIVNIDDEVRDRILSYDNIREFLGKYDAIVGCVPDYKGDSCRTSGGLKLSSKSLVGSFIIEKERITYDPTQRFYEERDAYVYGAGGPFHTFYTTSSMKDLLVDELQMVRECYLYMGMMITKDPLRCMEKFELVSQDELLSYADDIKKGEKLYQKILK